MISCRPYKSRGSRNQCSDPVASLTTLTGRKPGINLLHIVAFAKVVEAVAEGTVSEASTKAFLASRPPRFSTGSSVKAEHVLDPVFLLQARCNVCSESFRNLQNQIPYFHS
jgi:hypothetical protein